MVRIYNDFRGGWNADAAPDNLADNELSLADNADLDLRGAIGKRKGCVPLNSVSYGAQVERIIEWPRKDGSSVLLAVVGTTLARINDDGTKTDLITLDGPDVGWFVFQDKFWFTGKVAGADVYKTYDGTTVADVTPNSATDNDLAPIKRCRMFLWHPNSYRIFAAGDRDDRTVLYYSEYNDPTYFKNTSRLYPVTGDGPINAIIAFGDAVLAFYQRSVYAWKGIDPATDAEWGKLPVGQGALAERSVELVPGAVLYLGTGGIYSLGLGLLDYNVVLLASEELVKNFAKDKVTSIVRQIARPDLACAVFDLTAEKYLLAYTDDPASARNDKVLVLDWNLKSFARWTGLQVNDFCLRSNGDLLVAANNYILKLKQGYSDWDCQLGAPKPIEFQIKTKQFSLDYPVHVKKMRKLYLAAKQYGAEASNIGLSLKAGYVTYDYGTVSLDESLVWGELWGNVWGWDDYILKEIRCRAKGQRFEVTVSSAGLDEPATLYGLAFEYRVFKPKGVKVGG